MKLVPIILLLVGICSCTINRVGQRTIKRTEYAYSLKQSRGLVKSIFKKRNSKLSYSIYNTKGQVIEEGHYGKFTCKRIERKSPNGGRIIMYRSFHDYSQLDHALTMDFDSIGRKIVQKEWTYIDNKRDHLAVTTFYKYQANGAPIQEMEYNHENILTRRRAYIVKGSDSIIIDTLYKTYQPYEVKIINRDTYLCDVDGKKVRYTSYSDDDLISHERYGYSIDGTSDTVYKYNDSSMNELMCTQINVYNEQRQLESTTYKWERGGDVLKRIYHYDAQNRPRKILDYDNGKPDKKTIFRYQF